MLSRVLLWLHAQRTSLAFMAVTFLTGTGAAFFIPTLSLFLSNEVGAKPLWVGIFYTVNALAGIVVSQWLAKRSDKRGSRKKLIQLCCLAGVVSCLLFACSRSYLLLLTLGIVLLSVGATTSPQLFALAREYSEQQGRSATMFSAIMRTQFSLAWVAGPPLAFAIATTYGFTALFTLGSVAYLLSLWVVWRSLPDLGKVTSGQPLPRRCVWQNRDVRLLFMASVCLWTCNSMYLINMPLYLSQELMLPQALAGWMMGLAAALEIPVMLLAGYGSRWVGKKPMMLFAAFAGVLFYSGLTLLPTGPVTLLSLQLCNGIFIGIVAGMGMTYFQDLMPGQPGEATTLFSNSIRSGAILGGCVAGMTAQWWSYHGVFAVAVLLALCALLLMSRVREA